MRHVLQSNVRKIGKKEQGKILKNERHALHMIVSKNVEISNRK